MASSQLNLTRSHEGEHSGDYSDIALKLTRSSYIFALCAALNSCNLGYDIGVTTNVGPLVEEHFGLSDSERELFVGSLNFWSIIGSFFAHWICDKYGRRRSFIFAAISFIVGVILMAIAGSYTMLMVGRFFVGLGVGFGLAIDPLYIAEVTPASHRGELVTFSEIGINVGIVLGFFSGIVFYGVDKDVEWRYMLFSGAVLPCVMIVLVLKVMPESPRWLVGKGREGEAKEILAQVYPPGFDIKPIVDDMKIAIERDQAAERNVGWNMILFPTRAIKRMLLVGIGTAVAQQAVGIDAIQYYLVDLLEETGIESDAGRLAVLMMLGVMKLVFIIVGGKLFDRRGRKPLLMISLAGMAAALVLVSLSKGNVAIFGFALYLAFFSVGMGPGAWLIPSEIFATSIRAKAMSIATFSNRITATIMSSTFLTTTQAIGWTGFFLLLAAVCVVVLAFVYFVLPETKGRSLEDMTVYFAELTGDTSILEAEAKIKQDSGSGVEMT